MPRAAVPDYIGQHFDQFRASASPGLRFGIYLPIWTTRSDQEATVHDRASRNSHEAQQLRDTLETEGMDAAIERFVRGKEALWNKNDSAARAAWDIIKAINPQDRDRMTALAARQDAIALNTPDADASHFTIDATGIAPFVTGMGNEHPLENGFAFLNPHGLPYLPGSGVKGVILRAVEELATGEWGDDTFGWEQALDVKIGKNQTRMRVIDLLFGHDAEEGQGKDAMLFRGLLTFWDVIPQIKRELMVEIMTPHQSDYYQGQHAPHDSGNPTPISFLTVPPGSTYTFHVRLDTQRLQALGLETKLLNQWQPMLQAAFKHAFEWLGFGAKTALGYGAMTVDTDAQQRREQQRLEAKQQEEEASLTDEQKVLRAFRKATDEARTNGYKPGDAFDVTRNEYIKTVLEWTDPELRNQAADALDQSFSNSWGASKKKKKELTQTVRRLRGEEI